MADDTAAAAAAAAATATATATATAPEPRIDTLILDAAPLLTQQPLRGLASKFYMPPSVLAELKDKRAREHLEFLRSSGQIEFEVREPGALALSKVIAFAKKTGDYTVLSGPDLQVLALTYALEVERHGTWRIREEVGGLTGQQKADVARRDAQRAEQAKLQNQGEVKEEKETADREAVAEGETASSPTEGDAVATEEVQAPIEESEDDFQDAEEAESDDEEEDQDENEEQSLAETEDAASAQSEKPAAAAAHNGNNDDDESDGGEWITADNIRKFKNIDLGIVQSESSIVATATDEGAAESSNASAKKKKGKGGKGQGRMTVACMTADYAVQNVLLQMGLNLVSSDGLKITKVKSWVLRCHACFKICKDMERKFCPSCGNPTLLRTSVTTSAPGSASKTDKNGGLQVHLKKNFQYRNRGTIYSIPQPKAGTASSLKKSAAKHTVPILREDQVEWQRAVAQQNVQKRKEERALARALEKGKDTLSARYEDPDWMPDMLLAGGGGRQHHSGLPALGIGRKNPNEKRRARK
ncbi:20S-pre-rRNA D-site endonuclease nob1 [Tilletia horrida]|nr:20S-pre-rRNA D-site endonuclease nob1 [Tilletia horrida]